MSYILDALKKSERERSQKKVPDLHTVQDEPEPPRAKKRRIMPALILAALLLNSVFLLFWLSPWEEKHPPATEQAKAPGKAMPSQPQVEPARTAQRDLQPPPAPASRERHPEAAAPPLRQAANVPLQMTAAERSEAQPPPPPVTRSASPGENPAAAGTAFQAGEDEIPAESPEPLEPDSIQLEAPEGVAPFAPDIPEPLIDEQEQTQGQDPALADQQEEGGALRQVMPSRRLPARQLDSEADAPPTDTASAQPEVRELHELPQSVRRSLPDISIAALFYSKNPVSRLASINGKLVREGQTIAKGVKVEEITPQEVIFSYESYRFKKGVF